MSSTRPHKIAARFGAATSLAMFGLIVIGAVVRSTGSGLACPDWPLCQGRWIPPLEFHVLIEWTHRAVALGVSLLLLATTAWTLAHRELRRRLGGLLLLGVGLLFTQILLGALTVWKLLSPSVVNTHLAVALLLFSTMVTFTVLAAGNAEDAEEASVPAMPSRPGFLLPITIAVTSLVYLQSVIGGAVAAQHAGLACPDWPACNGEWFPPLHTLAGLQMLHRLMAYAMLAGMAVAAWCARGTADAAVRAGVKLALSLGFAQGVLGVCNVLLGTPVWVSATHLGAAAAILAVQIVLVHRVAVLPARRAEWIAVTS